MAIDNEDRERLYRQFRHSLGSPHRQIEVDDDQLCTFLEMAIEDYAQYVQEWLIEHQWQSLLGQSIDKTDMAFALSVRNFDFMTQYTYAYSKQVGLQARGPWELKKDYIDVVAGQQVYQIPAGREINEVLWITPSVTNMALFSNMGGMDMGFGGGFGQMGNGGGGTGGAGAGGTGGYYIAPAFDILLTAQDFNLKNRIVRSELVYKLTAGPDGTRLLHLLSVPGSRFTFGNGLGNGNTGSLNLNGCQVWYHYYDTSNGNADECKAENSDIIKLPNEVPLSKLDYSTFNEPTKTLVRKLFIGHGKRALGRTRGKFGGVVGTLEAQRTMDYESLITEGNDEIKETLERLDERLMRLSSDKQLERAANESENLNKHLKFRPMGIYIK
jgi:hypothetical protein